MSGSEQGLSTLQHSHLHYYYFHCFHLRAISRYLLHRLERLLSTLNPPHPVLHSPIVPFPFFPLLFPFSSSRSSSAQPALLALYSNIFPRTDKHQTFNDKVAAVERLLAEEGAGAEAQCQGPVVDENNDSNLTNPSGHNSSGGPITGCDGNDTGKDRTEKDVAKGILQRVEPGRLGGVEVSKEWGPL